MAEWVDHLLLAQRRHFWCLTSWRKFALIQPSTTLAAGSLMDTAADLSFSSILEKLDRLLESYGLEKVERVPPKELGDTLSGCKASWMFRKPPPIASKRGQIFITKNFFASEMCGMSLLKSFARIPTPALPESVVS